MNPFETLTSIGRDAGFISRGIIWMLTIAFATFFPEFILLEIVLIPLFIGTLMGKKR